MDADCERTPSGRKSRARAPQEDPRKTALEARQRVFGVSPADAPDPRVATVLGRLNLDGTITDSMYRAGLQYLDLYLAAMRAIKAPMSRGGGGASHDGDMLSDDYVVWAIKAVAHYEVMKAALEDAEQGGGEWCGQAVGAVVLENVVMPVWWTPELIMGLGILAKKMGIDRATG